MTIHARVLEAAVRLCRRGGGWTFRPKDVVAALTDLNPGSVRTHVMSRCCVNAPSNHPHRWPYFRRVGRGRYQVLPAWRRGHHRAMGRHDRTRGRGAMRAHESGLAVSESAAGYSARPGLDRRDAVVERYMRDVDRTLVRQSLRMTHEERIDALQDWMNFADAARGAARRGVVPRGAARARATARRRRQRVS